MKYSVKLCVAPNTIYFKMITWLTAEVGIENEDWTFGLYFGDGLKNVTDKFRFKREEDKIRFILRWA